MLTINRLEMENFGPYQKAEIDFPPTGVTIVWGQNTHGKTTLLNAIRYAFFGKNLTRGEEHISWKDTENREKAREGKHGFRVALHCSDGGTDYVVDREAKLKPGVKTPGGNQDYVEKVFLKRGSDLLDEKQSKIELGNLMPEAVSRFFLFDGELLKQYEELLKDESTMGEKIKGAIERILGVPVITSLRNNLELIEKNVQTRFTEETKRNRETKTLGGKLEVCDSKLDELNKGLDKSRSELESKKAELEKIEKKLRGQERVDALFKKRDELDDALAELAKDLDGKKKKLQDLCGSAWKWVLNRHSQDEIKALQAALNKIDAVEGYKKEHKKLAKSLAAKACRTCGQSLPKKASAGLEAELKKLDEKIERGANIEGQDKLAKRLNLFRAIDAADQSRWVEDLDAEINKLVVDEDTLERDKEEIYAAVADEDRESIQKLKEQHEQLRDIIPVLEKSISDDVGLVKKEELAREKIQMTIKRLVGNQAEGVHGHLELVKLLRELAAEGVGVYRGLLKEQVAKSATELFQRLITKKVGDGLKINDQYGLSITDKGEDVPIISSGAAHIVAMSLMGALQQNAPLKGPLVIDSAAGRLDSEHETNFLKTLPYMADQVVLLVFDKELDENKAKKTLKGNLKRQYQIKRISTTCSDLKLKV